MYTQNSVTCYNTEIKAAVGGATEAYSSLFVSNANLDEH